MNRWTGLKFDPMQYQGLRAASALDPFIPASDIPQREPARTRELAVAPLSPYDKPLEYGTGLAFADMTRPQKYIFVAKLLVCIATFGFVFPNVQNE
jgi:hypothetical protein